LFAQSGLSRTYRIKAPKLPRTPRDEWVALSATPDAGSASSAFDSAELHDVGSISCVMQAHAYRNSDAQ